MSQGEPVGTLAEEAARLLEAAQQWARGSLAEGAAVAGDDPECRVCPVCMVLRTVRGVRPETVEHLVEATGALAAALRSLVEAHEHTADGQQRRQPSAPVQRIDVQ